ncbi:hypothetical protein [Mycobacteroides abscessus]|uniref:hypothetical protein n=1 Tax=Mycobacteroides abscessus TaxID=36809 RepID=UPI001056E8DE|nr:hypothetical protein [Mycobacteroides abscessus]
MSGVLKVDPIDLYISAGHMDMHQADLAAAHSGADALIEGAMGGLVGTSALALQEKLLEWQGVTKELCGTIGYHHVEFKQAGVAYENTDSDSKGNIESAARGL